MAHFRAIRRPLMAAMAAVIMTQGQAASAAPDSSSSGENKPGIQLQTPPVAQLQLEKALKVIRTIVTQSSASAAGVPHKLAAELFEETGNYSDAARQFLEAGKSLGGLPTDERELLLLTAIDCAKKSENKDESLIKDASLELCGIIGGGDMAASLQMRQKVLAMLDDNDPEKPKQLSAIAFLSQEIAHQNLNPNSSSTQSKPKAEQIVLLKQAAELTAKFNPGESKDYWMRLANNEAQAGKLDDAIVHAREAINAYQATNAREHVWSAASRVEQRDN